jgi:hypothetical protein
MSELVVEVDAEQDDEVAVDAVLSVLRKCISSISIEAQRDVLSKAPRVVELLDQGIDASEAIRRAFLDVIRTTHQPYRLALEVMTAQIKEEGGTDWRDPRKKREARKNRIGQILERRSGSDEAGLTSRQVETIERSILARQVAHGLGFRVVLPVIPSEVKDDPELMSLAISAVEDGQLLLPPVLQAGLIEARITRFHPERRYYEVFREGRGKIADYVSGSTHLLEMVSINLATGNDMEMLIDTFEELILRRNPVKVRISLLDPDLEYLAQAIAPVINTTPDTLRSRVRDTVDSLEQLNSVRLPKSRKSYLEVWCHNCVPNGSAIILDGDSRSGLFQLETKGYRTGMQKSFGFEIAAGSDFFMTMRDSYRRLIADGRRVI